MNNIRLVNNDYIKRIILKTLLLHTILIYLLACGASWIATHPKRTQINATPAEQGLTYEDISFHNSIDGILLKGWWIPSYGDKTIIFSHGYGYNREEMPFSTLELAKSLHDEGYNILMFDFRNSGESGGDETTIGTMEYTDVLAAISFVAEEKDSKDIALFGWSMGASSSIIAGSKSEYVKAVIADSPFSNLQSYLEDSFSYWTKLPEFIGSFVSSIAFSINQDIEPEKVKPIEEISDNKPVFLIHAKDDPAIPVEESEKLEKASGTATLWTPEEGEHIRSYKHNKEEYEEKVKTFLNDNF